MKENLGCIFMFILVICMFAIRISKYLIQFTMPVSAFTQSLRNAKLRNAGWKNFLGSTRVENIWRATSCLWRLF